MLLKNRLNFLKIDVPLKNCVHYCGFRYGHDEYNPYQAYILDIHNGVSKEKRRERFVNFLKFYRPINMAQALGIKLSSDIPLWLYPWNRIYPWNKYRPNEFASIKGWYEEPNCCPDIITHFSKNGILEFRIDEEFVWLERAYYSIKKFGYIPKEIKITNFLGGFSFYRFASELCRFNFVGNISNENKNYLQLLRLIRNDNQESYLVLDGNHRVSAMHALGVKTFSAIVNRSVYERECPNWYCVRKNIISRDDALRIFYAYFDGNNNYKTTETPAQIIS